MAPSTEPRASRDTVACVPTTCSPALLLALRHRGGLAVALGAACLASSLAVTTAAAAAEVPLNADGSIQLSEGVAVIIDSTIPAVTRADGAVLRLDVPGDGAQRYCTLREYDASSLDSGFSWVVTVAINNMTNNVTGPFLAPMARPYTLELPSTVGHPASAASNGTVPQVLIRIKGHNGDGFGFGGASPAVVCVRDGSAEATPVDVMALPSIDVRSNNPTAVTRATLPQAYYRYGSAADSDSLGYAAFVTSGLSHYEGTADSNTRGAVRAWCLVTSGDATSARPMEAFVKRYASDFKTSRGGLPSPTDYDAASATVGASGSTAGMPCLVPLGTAVGMWAIAVRYAPAVGFKVTCRDRDVPFPQAGVLPTTAAAVPVPFGATATTWPAGAQYECLQRRCKPRDVFGLYFLAISTKPDPGAQGACRFTPAAAGAMVASWTNDGLQSMPTPQVGLVGSSGIVDLDGRLAARAASGVDAVGESRLALNDTGGVVPLPAASASTAYLLVTGSQVAQGMTVECGPRAAVLLGGASPLIVSTDVPATFTAAVDGAMYFRWTPALTSGSDQAQCFIDSIDPQADIVVAWDQSRYPAPADEPPTTKCDCSPKKGTGRVDIGTRRFALAGNFAVAGASTNYFRVSGPATAQGVRVTCGYGIVSFAAWRLAADRTAIIIGLLVACVLAGLLATRCLFKPPQSTPERLVLWVFPGREGYAFEAARFAVPVALIIAGLAVSPGGGEHPEDAPNSALLAAGTAGFAAAMLCAGPKTYDFDATKGTLVSTRRMAGWLPVRSREYQLSDIKSLRQRASVRRSSRDNNACTWTTAALGITGGQDLETTAGCCTAPRQRRHRDEANTWLEAYHERMGTTFAADAADGGAALEMAEASSVAAAAHAGERDVARAAAAKGEVGAGGAVVFTNPMGPQTAAVDAAWGSSDSPGSLGGAPVPTIPGMGAASVALPPYTSASAGVAV